MGLRMPTEFAQSNSAYAALYNCAKRTISQYKLEGLPLDDPIAMAVCLKERQRRKGVSKFRKKAPVVATATIDRPAGEPVPGTEDLKVTSGKYGMSENLANMRAVSGALYNKFALALKAGDPMATSYRRDWSEMSEDLRRAEESTPKVLIANGEVYIKTEVTRALVTFTSSLWSVLENHRKRVGPKVVGLRLEDVYEELRKEMEIVGRSFRILGELGWTRELMMSNKPEDVEELLQGLSDVHEGFASFFPKPPPASKVTTLSEINAYNAELKAKRERGH